MRYSQMLLSLTVLSLLSPLAACSDRGDAGARGRRTVVDSSGGTVALGIGTRRSYRPSGTAATGAISGRISLQGIARDSVVAVGRDAKVCGDSIAVSETEANGNELANALVWVDGVTSGKPLPDVRRETLTIEKCRFEPRVMAVVTGSTINVFSRDRVAHGPRFYREGAAQPIEEINTVDAGQVVPSEKIAREPGIIEVRCSEHPFARAYIAVFDHPYFAVSDEQGAFKIDGLPAGTYNVKVWQERLGKPIERRVVVQPDGSGRLDVSLALK
jgi:hypothetical protein